MEKIEVKGLENFKPEEVEEATRIIEKNLEKIKRMIDNDFYLRITLKDYTKNPEKSGRRRLSVNLELSGEIPRINASALEWDLNKVLNIAFSRLLLEIEHKFHISNKY